MEYRLYTEMSLAKSLPEQGLRQGDVVKLVDHHLAPDGEEGYSVEVFNAFGETVGVACVPESALAPLVANEVLSVRPLAVAT
jgi:hypothetical protein